MTPALSTVPAVRPAVAGPLPRAERVLEAVIALGHLTRLDHGSGEYLSTVAEAICTALDFGVCVIYLYDRFDDAFYAEATYGVDPEERHEVLATPVPARVVERLWPSHSASTWGYYVPGAAPVWNDPEVRRASPCRPVPTPHCAGRLAAGDIFLLPLRSTASSRSAS